MEGKKEGGRGLPTLWLSINFNLKVERSDVEIEFYMFYDFWFENPHTIYIEEKNSVLYLNGQLNNNTSL